MFKDILKKFDKEGDSNQKRKIENIVKKNGLNLKSKKNKMYIISLIQQQKKL